MTPAAIYSKVGSDLGVNVGRSRRKTEKVKLGKIEPRNPYAVAARFRKAGAMGDRRMKRLGEKERKALREEIEG